MENNANSQYIRVQHNDESQEQQISEVCFFKVYSQQQVAVMISIHLSSFY